jgi:organic hydroperoxide reductase OsmC/OhrA
MAHQYRASVRWGRDGATFTDNKYSRRHVWAFDEGLEVPASSSPLSVRVPLSVAAAVDPEEALVAAIASCHMLFFLAFAAHRGFVVDRYEDAAVGTMGKNEHGKDFIAKVELNPAVVFAGAKLPSEQDVAALHHRAHEECYIANSVKSEVILAGATFSLSS